MTRRTALLLMFAAALLIPSSAWNLSLHAAGQEIERTAVENIPSNTGYLSASNQHKIKLPKGELATKLAKRGARVVADYGDTTLLEVDTATATALRGDQSVELRDEDNLIMLSAGSIDTTTPRGIDLQSASASAKGSEKRLQLVQFAGPIKPEWYETMINQGVEVVTYIPNNAYLIYGDSAALLRMKNLAKAGGPIQWQGDYADVYKLDPNIFGREKQELELRLQGKVGSPSNYFIIQVLNNPKNAQTMALIDQVKTNEKVRWNILNYTNVIVGLSFDTIKQVAARPDVVFIEVYDEMKKKDERQNMIISNNLSGTTPVTGLNWLTYLANKGFTQAQFDTSNFLVNISDSGIDNASTANPNHFAFHRSGDLTLASRLSYARLVGTPNGGSTIQGCDGHGTENGSIIMGFVTNGSVGGVDFNASPHADASGFHFGLGVCPFVKLGSSVIFDPDNFTNPNVSNLEAQAYSEGSRISSNSWGNSSNTYGTFGQSYDALVRDAQPATSTFPAAGNQEYVIVFAAGNGGSGANTVGQPGTAKNIITAGASENVQPFGGSDGCAVPDSGADSALDIINFSSRGPTSDGRKKPDLVAPGTHVSGVVAQAAALATGTGAANACFDATGVCGGPGPGFDFFPLSQQFYTASSGTSHSTPAIAGAAALVRQFFLNQFAVPPSPAMTKASLMNSASYMNGVGANDNLWSNSQGMGLMNIDRLFTTLTDPSIIRDQQAADLFTATGQQRVFTGTVSDNTKPFRVTLAWTDVPGPTSGNAFVNNLDLEVTVGGNTFKGNVFSGANSATGGVADAANNVESVFVPAGVTGPFVVRVKATNIAGDGVPGNASALDQDFALIVTNSVAGSFPVLASAGATLVTESCTPANGALDPGETVTVSFCLQNLGTLNTTNLVGTLAATGGVTGPSGPQNYGLVVAGGSAVCRNFTFTASGTCGGTVTATIQLQDGATNLGTVTYDFTLGTQVVVLSENFDGVTAPALPAGWTTSFVNGAANCTPTGTCALGNNWTTSITNTPPSAPNAAFHNNPTCVTDNYLVSPALNIISNAVLTFSQARNIESTFDGTVLEVSTDGGSTWTDVIANGGSFVSGGYNGPISVNFLSPIAGRMAWTGLSGGSSAAPAYITSVVNLGPNVNGQTINLRWRVASDCSLAASGTSGQWIDNISLTGGFQCCTGGGGGCVLTCPANVTVASDPNQCGATVNYPAPTASGTCGTVTCTPASGSFFPVGTTTVTCNATGASCSFTITVNDTQPPTITCPTNQSAVTDQSACQTGGCQVVNYPAPVAADNCPGVVAVCDPPSGSCFPTGVATVTCTATDASGNTATCSFTVTTFDTALQDDSNPGNILLWNSMTGAYRYCCNGTTYIGVGKPSIQGCVYTLQHSPADRRVLGKVDKAAHSGTASLQSPPGKIRCTITDRNTLNDVNLSSCQ